MPARGNILSFSPSNPSLSSTADVAAEGEGTTARAAEALAALVLLIQESGMDPVTQLAGYLTTDDPTYLPDRGHARLLAQQVGRDKLLEALIEAYLPEGPREGGLPS